MGREKFIREKYYKLFLRYLQCINFSNDKPKEPTEKQNTK